MSSAEEVQRPVSVTVIGWVWLVLAAISLLRSVVNLVVWTVMGPAFPRLLGVVAERSPQPPFLRPLLDHLGALMTIQAIASIAVGVAAWQLLRLRPWARIAVEVICWLVLVYVVSFACFWVWLWTRVSAGTIRVSSPAQSHPMTALVAGLAVALALAAGLTVMIAFLRGETVRRAFGYPGAGSPSSPRPA